MKPTQPPSDGPITKALLEAVTMRRQMLDAGHPPEEVDTAIGVGLKALLGNKRAEPWKFYCEHCHDSGWINVLPSLEREAKLAALYGHKDCHQGYVMACEPCKWRAMEREKRRKQQGLDGGEDDFAMAGQIKKPTRNFSKFGS